MKYIVTFALLILACLNQVYASQPGSGNVSKQLMSDLTDNVRRVCLAPSEKGKYWEITGKGDAGVEVKIRSLKIGGGKLAGSGEFTNKEWDGVIDVLQKEYSECVQTIAPLFIKTFFESSVTKPNNLVSSKESNGIHYQLKECENINSKVRCEIQATSLYLVTGIFRLVLQAGRA